jgi:succinate dehydrogenase/fumarate reductase flavoprotein subunit
LELFFTFSTLIGSDPKNIVVAIISFIVILRRREAASVVLTGGANTSRHWAMTVEIREGRGVGPEKDHVSILIFVFVAVGCSCRYS